MAVKLTAEKPVKKPITGVITAGVSQHDVIVKYNELLKGEASVYTSKSGKVSIVSDLHTHIFNPYTSLSDLNESDDTGLEMYSLSSVDNKDAHLGQCKDGCGAYILASSSSMLKFCPVCSGAVDDLGDDEDEDEDDDLGEFDDSYEAESSSKKKSTSGDDCDDEECDEESEDDSDDSEDSDEDSEDDSEDSDDDGEDFDSEARVMAVASSRKVAIKKFVAALVEQESTKYQSVSTNASLFASSESGITFDPATADVVKEGTMDLESMSSVLDTVKGDKIESHYMVCSSSSCGSHVVSNFETKFCPVCASDLEEPEVDENEEDIPEDDAGLDLDVSFDEDGEGGDDEYDDSLSNVLSVVAGGNELMVDRLDVAYCGRIAGEPSWTAFYNGQPIAKATASSASKHKAIFEDPAFGNAVLAGAQELGIAKILTEMGFEPSMSSIAMSETLKKNILNRHFKDKLTAMSKQIDKEVSDRTSDYQKRFVAALSTAAMGINRGFFKGYNNPMKHSLWNTLSASGVRNAELVIDSVFKSQSDDYHKSLIEKTLEIMSKPLEVQNELAQAVAESNYMEVTASAQDDVESRLSGLGTVVQPAERQVSTSNAQSGNNVITISTDRIKTVVAGLGKR